MVDTAAAAKVGFGGRSVRDYRDAHDNFLFHPHPGQNTGDARGGVEQRGNYQTDESICELELWAICILDWRLGRSVACVKSLIVREVARTRRNLTPGMHPTANSVPLIARLVRNQVECAAGDAGR